MRTSKQVQVLGSFALSNSGLAVVKQPIRDETEQLLKLIAERNGIDPTRLGTGELLDSNIAKLEKYIDNLCFPLREAALVELAEMANFPDWADVSFTKKDIEELEDEFGDIWEALPIRNVELTHLKYKQSGDTEISVTFVRKLLALDLQDNETVEFLTTTQGSWMVTITK